MSRYKDVDEILEAMDTWPKYGCNPDGRFIELTKETEADYVPYVHYDDMVQAVTGTPVQDVAPVFHAHWYFYETENAHQEDIKCSNCKKYFTIDAYNYCDIGFTKHDLHYCPNCGAKMDEKEGK